MNFRQTKLAISLTCLLSFSLNISAKENQVILQSTTKQKSIISKPSQEYKQWGLTEQEYARYEYLMKGIRGAISPANISPIEVLGIHAKTDAERKKYARMWADMMDKDTARVLAFQHAYDQAWVEKGNPPLIDISKLNLIKKSSSKSLIKAPKHYSLLFTKLDNKCAKCATKLSKSLNLLLIDSSAKLDIYFTDSTGKGAGDVRAWARHNNVNLNWLKQGRVSLKQGKSLLSHYKISEKDLPVLFTVDETGRAKRVQ